MSVSGTARNDGSQNLHFIGKDIAFNTTGVGTADTIKVGAIPAGSMLFPAQVRITTAFNAASTNVLVVGTSSGSNADIIGASEVNEAATGVTIVATGASLTFASDTIIYVKYSQTGTAATTGAATIIIPYAPPNY